MYRTRRLGSGSATCITDQEAVDCAATLRDRLGFRFTSLGDAALLDASDRDLSSSLR